MGSELFWSNMQTRAILFRSPSRFEAFEEALGKRGIRFDVLSFDDRRWMDYDFGKAGIAIYFPMFRYSSNHPQALWDVQANLSHIVSRNRNIRMFPDPHLVDFYNDKYRQYLYLSSNGYPIPETIPLLSVESVDAADKNIGYPMVVKNRFGAGGDYVFMVSSRSELNSFYKLSCLDFFNVPGFFYFLRRVLRRRFFYDLIKARQLEYPFLSFPLLAQKYIPHERDLKVVVGSGKVVEGHWRYRADENKWKVNIDGGGIGEWSFIQPEAMELSLSLAKSLGARWLNLDILMIDNRPIISEFSPVWHHYAYKEKESFVYRDDYNVGIPLQTGLNLEWLIVESLLNPNTSFYAEGQAEMHS